MKLEFRLPTNRNLHLLAALCFGLCFGTQGAVAIAQLNIPPLPERGSTFRVSLQANKSTFTAGDSILIRVAISNVSSQHYRVQIAPAFYLVALLVRDASGTVQQSPGITGLVRRDVRAYDFPPGKTIEPGWRSAEDPTGQWVNLQLWGYTLPAGTYTIEAVPRFDAVEVNENHSLGKRFRIARVPSSNTVTITIRP